MDLIPLPNKIQYKEGDQPNKGVLTIEPCYSGYGTTIGNALRRVILSSMPGAAVTGIKIKGVDHEFSTIPNVKEDVLEVILNFKQLRVKVHSDEEEVKLKIKLSGAKEVFAKDIESNSDVEVISSDLKLFTITDPKATIEMDLYVSKGMGYLPTEVREKEKLEVGVIAIDSIFTPMKNVGYRVENVRVGQMTNYEKVILDIETDGSILPTDAVKLGAKILTDHISLLTGDFENNILAESTDTAENEESTSEEVEEEVEEK